MGFALVLWNADLVKFCSSSHMNSEECLIIVIYTFIQTRPLQQQQTDQNCILMHISNYLRLVGSVQTKINTTKQQLSAIPLFYSRCAVSQCSRNKLLIFKAFEAKIAKIIFVLCFAYMENTRVYPGLCRRCVFYTIVLFGEKLFLIFNLFTFLLNCCQQQ